MPGNPQGGAAAEVANLKQDLMAMSQRIQALEMLLQSYQEANLDFEMANGQTRGLKLLVQPGSSVPSTRTASSTLSLRSVEQKNGAWVITFHPAKLYEHSLHGAGQEHEIAAGAGKLHDEKPPELPITQKDSEVWLVFGVAKEGKVKQGSVKIMVGKPPKKELMQPVRPKEDGSAAGKDGIHTQKVGRFTWTNNTPTWVPENTSCLLDIFLPPIETKGGGVPLFFKYNPDTKTDEWSSIMGKANAYGGLAEDGFETREVPVKIIITKDKNGKIEVDGLCQILVPNGKTGEYSWRNCNATDSEPAVTLNLRRGIAIGNPEAGGDVAEGDSKAGDFEACACDECSSTFTEGP